MALVDERGCRRDIRSNGWIVFRESSLFQRVCCFKIGPAEETGFLRSVRNICSAISPGQKLSVKSGPDVFADALGPRDASFPGTPRSSRDALDPLGRYLFPWDAIVPAAGAIGARRLDFPKSVSISGRHRLPPPCDFLCARDRSPRVLVSGEPDDGFQRATATVRSREPPARQDHPPAPNSQMTPRACDNGYRSTKRHGKPILTIASKHLRRSHFCDFAPARGVRAFTPRSSRYLNCLSNLIGHDRSTSR